MITVTPATLEEAYRYYDAHVQHFIGRSGDTVLGMVALTKVEDRTWAFVDIANGLTRAQKIAAVRAIAKGMQQIGGTIYVTCNIGVHHQAVRLLNALGFEPTDEARNGLEVYRWQS